MSTETTQESTGHATVWPPSRALMDWIAPRLAYGAVFEWREIRAALGIVPLDEPLEWPDLRHWLEVQRQCEGLGYIFTAVGLKGRGVRILAREEMADHVQDDMRRHIAAVSRRAITVSMVPRDGLTGEQVKQLDRVEVRGAFAAAHAAHILRHGKTLGADSSVRSTRELALA